MLPIVSLLALQRAIDGEDAVALARKFLQRMGVPKVAGLVSLTEREEMNWGPPEKVWSVGFDLADGGGFSVTIDGKGTVLYASGGGKKGPNLDEASARKYADALMSKVPGAVPTSFQYIARGSQEGASARYIATVDGKRFFNQNPTYGYFLSFDRKGRLTSFSRMDKLPHVGPRKAKVSRNDAIRMLTKEWNDSKPGSWPEPRYVEPELGYFLVKGEPKARLVWRGEVFTGPRDQKRQFSTLNVLADATTGELIRGDGF